MVITSCFFSAGTVDVVVEVDELGASVVVGEVELVVDDGVVDVVVDEVADIVVDVEGGVVTVVVVVVGGLDGATNERVIVWPKGS